MSTIEKPLLNIRREGDRITLGYWEGNHGVVPICMMSVDDWRNVAKSILEECGEVVPGTIQERERVIE